MEGHLRTLGWSHVEIIDEDLGRSAGGTVMRTGFERMVAQVLCSAKIAKPRQNGQFPRFSLL
jgi:hypothetical protein